MLGLPLRSTSPELYDKAWVAGMFASGEQGVWYEPSPSNGTCFQDAAGTTPAVLEGPVGLMRDLSGRGNHATQVTSANRPVLSARYNLLTYTNYLSNWNYYSLTATPNFAISPIGTKTATLVKETTSNGQHIAYYPPKFSVTSGSYYRFSVYIKKHTSYRGGVNCGFGGSLFSWAEGCRIDLNALTITHIPTGGSNARLTNVGNDWYRFEYTQLAPSSGTADVIIGTATTSSVYTGDGVSGIYVWGASLVPANQSHLPYQRVDTATSYDADPIKFPAYLKFNGTNSWMKTGNIDFTGTDKMTVVAGVRPTTTGPKFIYELSNDSQGNNGAFAMTSTNIDGTKYVIYSRGTIGKELPGTSFPPPQTCIATGITDISGKRIIFRVNGNLNATASMDQGTGNYGNYPLFIGARNGNQYLFNGNLHSLIIRGAATDAAHITHAERLVAYKTGVSI